MIFKPFFEFEIISLSDNDCPSSELIKHSQTNDISKSQQQQPRYSSYLELALKRDDVSAKTKKILVMILIKFIC